MIPAHEDWKPVTLLGPSIVIQIRGLNDDGVATHLGIVHLANEQAMPIFQDQLEKVLNSCTGKVEVFIGGGTSSSKKLWEKVRRYLEAQSKRLTLRDDCYSVTDLATLYFKQESKTYTGSTSVEVAGFDDLNRPFMVVTTNFPKGTPSFQDGELWSMINPDYRIRV